MAGQREAAVDIKIEDRRVVASLNEEGRIIYLNDELTKELKALQKDRPSGCVYVFYHNVAPIRDFRGLFYHRGSLSY